MIESQFRIIPRKSLLQLLCEYSRTICVVWIQKSGDVCFGILVESETECLHVFTKSLTTSTTLTLGKSLTTSTTLTLGKSLTTSTTFTLGSLNLCFYDLNVAVIIIVIIIDVPLLILTIVTNTKRLSASAHGILHLRKLTGLSSASSHKHLNIKSNQTIFFTRIQNWQIYKSSFNVLTSLDIVCIFFSIVDVV